MKKIKTVKIKEIDGSIGEESYAITADAKDVDMSNGRSVQETIGTIDIDKNGNIATQLKNKISKNNIVDDLESSDPNKVLSANQGKILGDKINKKPYHFNNIEDMKKANLKAGDMVLTLGYYEANDGGAARYIIVNDSSLTADGGSVHDLKNGLKAVLLLENNMLNVKQFGAKGNANYYNEEDGEYYENKSFTILANDDTDAINTAVNFKFSITGNNINSNATTLFFPCARYVINRTIWLSNNFDVDGNYSIIYPKNNFEGSYLFATNVKEDYPTDWIIQTPHRHAVFKNLLPTDLNHQNIGLLLLGDTREVKRIMSSYMGWVIHSLNKYIDSVTIKDINVNAPSGGEYQIYLYGAGDGALIDNCHFYGSKEEANSGNDEYCVGTNIFINAIRMGNHNATITNCINGRIYLSVGKYNIDNFHCEAGQVIIKDAEASINNSILWENPENYSPIYVVNTSSIKSGFSCTLSNITFYVLQRFNFTVERADIDISDSSGSVLISNCSRRIFSSNSSESTRFRTLPTVKTISDIYNMINPVQNFVEGQFLDNYFISDNQTSNFGLTLVDENEYPYNLDLAETTYTIREVFNFDRLLCKTIGEKTITPVENKIVSINNIHQNVNTFLYIEKIVNNTIYYAFIPYMLGNRLYDFGNNISGIKWKTRVTSLEFNRDISSLEMHGQNVKIRQSFNPSLGEWKRGDENLRSDPSTSSTWLYALNTTNHTPTWQLYNFTQA